MYFKNFPNIIYDFDIGGKEVGIYLKDITRNIRFRRDILSYISVYDIYNIIEGDTPEKIAERLYGNSNYHWIIMLINERYDYIKDFPLSMYDLQNHINNSYGSENIYNIHHYENSDGFIVNSDAVGAIPVTNLDYEENINESKRSIKIVSQSIIEQILIEFKKIL